MTQSTTRAARLRHLLAQDPGNLDLACELADALCADGDVRAAMEALDALPAEACGQPAIAFRRARISLITGDFADAAERYEAMLDLGHDGVAVRHDLAFTRMCQGQLGEARRVVGEGVHAFGPSPDLALLLARVEAMDGNLQACIAAADTALALRQDDPSALGVKALALFDSGDHAAAASVGSEALARDPDQHEALLAVASVQMAQQQFGHARATLERALSRHPGSGRALSAFGQVLMLDNELPRATDVLDAASRAMPAHIGTWHALAWSQLLQGKVQDAQGSYRAAYEIDRNFGDTHGGLALIDALHGRLDDAEAGIKRALRLDPAAATARYAEAIVREARGDEAGAEAILASLLPGQLVGTALSPGEFGRKLKSVIQAAQR